MNKTIFQFILASLTISQLMAFDVVDLKEPEKKQKAESKKSSFQNKKSNKSGSEELLTATIKIAEKGSDLKSTKLTATTADGETYKLVFNKLVSGYKEKLISYEGKTVEIRYNKKNDKAKGSINLREILSVKLSQTTQNNQLSSKKKNSKEISLEGLIILDKSSEKPRYYIMVNLNESYELKFTTGYKKNKEKLNKLSQKKVRISGKGKFLLDDNKKQIVFNKVNEISLLN